MITGHKFIPPPEPAPKAQATLPTDAKVRKNAPIATGVLDYFPDALFEVAELSKIGNDQHNPGQPMHWAKEKSTDHADCVVRHLIDRGTRDTDGVRHAAKVAWRALALLQIEIEEERKRPLTPATEKGGAALPLTPPGISRDNNPFLYVPPPLEE